MIASLTLFYKQTLLWPKAPDNYWPNRYMYYTLCVKSFHYKLLFLCHFHFICTLIIYCINIFVVDLQTVHTIIRIFNPIITTLIFTSSHHHIVYILEGELCPLWLYVKVHHYVEVQNQNEGLMLSYCYLSYTISSYNSYAPSFQKTLAMSGVSVCT